MARILAAVFLMAVVTYIPRFLPIALMKGRLKSPFIKSFLYYIPYAVLGAMIFPGILNATGNLVTSIIGMITALILAYFEKGLLTVAVISIIMVYIYGLIVKCF